MHDNQSSPGQFQRVVGRIIDMTPGGIGWGHNVIWATHGNDIETVVLVTTPAPRVGDTFLYYVEDAEVIEVKPLRNPRDMYEIRVRSVAPNPKADPAAVVGGSASSELLGGAVGGDSASGAAVDHGSTAIRSGGDQPASPLARLASPGKSGSNLTAATGTFATSRAVLAEADRSDALTGATGEPNTTNRQPESAQPLLDGVNDGGAK